MGEARDALTGACTELAGAPKKREFARIVSYASVLMRVREVKLEPGSSAGGASGCGAAAQ